MLLAAVYAKTGTDDLQETLSRDRLECTAWLEGLVAAAVSAGHIGHWAAGVESGAGGAQSLSDHTPASRDDTCNQSTDNYNICNPSKCNFYINTHYTGTTYPIQAGYLLLPCSQAAGQKLGEYGAMKDKLQNQSFT